MEYTIKDTTHYLKCRHCIGKNCMDYYMSCIPLGKTKKGYIKILVFGDRNWKDRDDRKRIRYVEPNRIIEK